MIALFDGRVVGFDEGRDWLCASGKGVLGENKVVTGCGVGRLGQGYGAVSRFPSLGEAAEGNGYGVGVRFHPCGVRESCPSASSVRSVWLREVSRTRKAVRMARCGEGPVLRR